MSGSNSSGQAFKVARAVARAESPVSVLIAGCEGSGQAEVAGFLATALLCLNMQSGEACGECKACGAASRGLCGDLLVIEPEGKSDWVSVDRINMSKERLPDKPPVRDFLRVGPVQARHKVVLICEAERLTPDAANALLKLLEEPPEYARFILTTSAASKLPPTIRSRCLLIACELPTIRMGDADPQVLAAGAEELAQALSGGESTFAQEFFGWVRSLWSRPRSEALKASEEFQAFAKSYRELRGKADEEGERAIRTEFIGLFANAVASEVRQGRLPLRLLERALEAHRSVQGNVRFEYVVDSMFVESVGVGGRRL